MTPDLPDVAKVETTIVEMTNAFRKANKLTEVKPNAVLTAAARAFAKYLATKNLFSHTADGRQPAERATKAGYDYCQIAENLALHQDSRGFATMVLAEKAIDGWENSPGHRRNLLAPHVTEIGVGVAKGPEKDPKYISVQLFGRPKSLAFEFKITNATPEVVTYEFSTTQHEIKPSFAVTHTSCQPGSVKFETFGSGKKAKTLGAQYQAVDGQVYTLKPDKTSGVRIEVALKTKGK